MLSGDQRRPDCHHRRGRQRHRGAQHGDLSSLQSSRGDQTSGTIGTRDNSGTSVTRVTISGTSSKASSKPEVAGGSCLVLGIFLSVGLPVEHLGLLAAGERDPGDEVIFPVDPNLGDPLLLHHDVLRGLVVEFPTEITERHDGVAWDGHQSLRREMLDVVRNRR